MRILLLLLTCCLLSCEGGYSSYTYQSVPSTTVRTYRSYTPTYHYYNTRTYYPPIYRYNYRAPRVYTTVRSRSYRRCP